MTKLIDVINRLQNRIYDRSRFLMSSKIVLFLIVCILTFAGCQSPGRIAIKATPSRIFVDKFDYTVEFLLDDERIR